MTLKKDELKLVQLTATPANPASGENKLYFKNNGKAYQLDSSGNETELGSVKGPSTRSGFPTIETEFLSVEGHWFNMAIGNGTLGVVSGQANHPGIFSFSKTTTANTGYGFFTNKESLLMQGTEETEIVFQVKSTASLVARLGFLDSYDTATPVDGAWINIAGATLSGRTRNNNAESATSSTYTIAVNTWYAAKIAVNTNATRVDFYLYSESGTLLWSGNLTTNIPAGRDVGHMILAFGTDTTAAALFWIDYTNYSVGRILTR